MAARIVWRTCLSKNAQRVVKLALLSALSSALLSCGTDAEQRYAGLSKHDVTSTEVSYRVRYLAPPWEKLRDDPLVTGARKSVPLGEGLRDVVPGTGAVLYVPRTSNLSGPEELFFAKYRLEVAALRCADEELSAGSSCAQWLADTDYAGRITREDGDFFGGAPRADSNDFDQPFYELMTRDAESSRYRRIAYFETSTAALSLRVYIEGNPDLSELEITNMLRAFEVLRPSKDAGAVHTKREGGT